MSTRALAICCRSASGGVEVLGRSRRGVWTIPSRPSDAGETPESAAIRELREEACVTGGGVAAPIADVPVIKNVGDLLLLRASRTRVYLVRAEASASTDEVWRTPTWFRPLDARIALAKGRIWWAARSRLAALDAPSLPSSYERGLIDTGPSAEGHSGSSGRGR